MISNAVVVPEWAVSECHLHGDDLLVFSFIYGYTQGDVNWYETDINAIADTFEIDAEYTQEIVQHLIDLRLIRERAFVFDDVKRMFIQSYDPFQAQNPTAEKDAGFIVRISD